MFNCAKKKRNQENSMRALNVFNVKSDQNDNSTNKNHRLKYTHIRHLVGLLSFRNVLHCATRSKKESEKRQKQQFFTGGYEMSLFLQTPIIKAMVNGYK